MVCSNCGANLSDTAKFCKLCGTPVKSEPKKLFCPSCGAEAESDSVFCEECGERLDSNPQQKPNPNPSPSPRPQPKPNPTPSPRPTPAPNPKINSNVCIAKAQLITYYPGETNIGVGKATGTLCVYSDRVQMDVKMGNSMAGALGIVGMAVSANKAKKEANNLVFYMNQIRIARESTYGGIMPSMILELKNGEKHTFAGSVNKSALQSCINAINQYKK